MSCSRSERKARVTVEWKVSLLYWPIFCFPSKYVSRHLKLIKSCKGKTVTLIVTWSTIRSFNELCFITHVTSDVTCEKGFSFSALAGNLSKSTNWFTQPNCYKEKLFELFQDGSLTVQRRVQKRGNDVTVSIPPSHPFMSPISFPSHFLSRHTLLPAHFLLAIGSIEEDECSIQSAMTGWRKAKRFNRKREEESNKSSPLLLSRPPSLPNEVIGN